MSYGNSSAGPVDSRTGSQQYAAGYAGGYDDTHPPRPSVGFVEAIKLFFKNYATFYGRASRSEYWWVQLWGLIFGVVVGILAVLTVIPAAASGSSELPVGYFVVTGLASLVGLAVIVPSLSVEVRRLHDAGFSGSFVLFRLVGLSLVPLIMCIMQPKPDGFRFDNPDGSQPVTA